MTNSAAKPFELIAGHPALDLVNTLNWRFRESGTEELLPDYAELLRFAEQSALISPRQARQMRQAASERTAKQTFQLVIDLREAAAAIFYALLDERTPPPDAIKKLDYHLHVAQANCNLHWAKDSGFTLHWTDTVNPQLPLWMLSQSAADLLVSEAAASLRECANAECRWLFLDTSKNRSRRWCDMKICGNRMKARRFKAQHKA